MSTNRMKPDPTRGAQANNVVSPSPEAILRAVELLRQGQVVGLPTETVYGLAGDGLNPAALARIFEVKQRPLFDPLILHFADAAGAFDLAEQIPTGPRTGATFLARPAHARAAKKGRWCPIWPRAACRMWPCACRRIPWRRPSSRVRRSARRAEREPVWPHQPDGRASRARRTGRSRAADSRRRALRGRPRIDRAFSFRTSARAAAGGRDSLEEIEAVTGPVRHATRRR
jgi:hypothetical protein